MFFGSQRTSAEGGESKGSGVTMLVDYQIERLVEQGLIENFYHQADDDLPLPAGLTSCGYRLRLSPEAHESIGDGELVDPSSPFHSTPTQKMPLWSRSARWHQLGNWDKLIVEPRSFVLARSIEVFNLPKDIVAVCQGISDYARCGLHIDVATLEPGWKGQAELKIFNHSNNRIRLFPGRGICQLHFYRIEPSDTALKKKSQRSADSLQTKA